MAELGQAGISRRELLGRGGGVAAAALTARLLGRPVANALAPSRHGPLTYAQFAGQIGTWFDLGAQGKVVRVRLLEATPHSPRRQDGRPITGEAFSLLFGDAPKGASLNGTYTVRHRALGSFSLFVAPVGRPAAGRFEAVVNRSSAVR